MSVHVRDGLATVRPGVEDDPVAVAGYPLADRHLVGVLDHVGEQAIAGTLQLGQVGQVGARDHEHVNGGLRVYVTERHSPRSLGDDRGWHLAGCNTAKQTIGHVKDLIVWAAGGASDIYRCTCCEPHAAPPLGATAPARLLAIRRPRG